MVEFCDSLKQFWMVKVEEDGWSALHFASKEGHLQAELFQEWLWKFQLILSARVESGEVCQTLIQFRADAGLGPLNDRIFVDVPKRLKPNMNCPRLKNTDDKAAIDVADEDRCQMMLRCWLVMLRFEGRML